jgi:glutathione synthase
VLLGIAISRATSMDATWTTVHVARAALARGHRVRFIEPWDFEIDVRGQFTARTHAFDPPAIDAETIVRKLHQRQAMRRYLRVDTLDVLLLRAAPLDPTLLAFATMAKDLGVEVVNDPHALIRVGHKAWLAGLADVPTPPTLVTQSAAQAQLFYEKYRRPVVVKPSRGSGCHGVTFVRRRDPQGFDTAFADARGYGDHVVVQVYLEEAEQGEKRIVWMDGEVLGGYLRRRAPGEFRHNLKQGATAEPTTITPTELGVVARLTPHLRRAGLRLAGIDLIGAYVIEVNALNPGGAFHADRLHDSDVSGSIVERLERDLATRAGGGVSHGDRAHHHEEADPGPHREG